MRDPSAENDLLSTTTLRMKLGAAADAPEFVVRAKHEVLRLLNLMLDQQLPLKIRFLHAKETVSSALIFIDEASNTLLFDCPPQWQTIIGAGTSVAMISCALPDSKLEFQGGPCAMVDLDGLPVVGVPIPEFMWRFQRRLDSRQKESGLKIVLNMGFLQADAELADLSVNGIGVLICHPEVKLDIGEVLHRCAIALPGVGPIATDLIVQHQTQVTQPDGTVMTRVGCRFSGLKENARQLIAHYLEMLATA